MAETTRTSRPHASTTGEISLERLLGTIHTQREDENELTTDYNEQDVIAHNLINSLNKARVVDLRVKIAIRIILVLFFMSILTLQNYQVFSFINTALSKGNIFTIQPILAVVISGTLAETYFIIRKIVDWAMKESDYDPHLSNNT